MSARMLRSAFVATVLLVGASIRSAAQNLIFNSCSTSGVCGNVDAVLSGGLLTLRVENLDNIFGSALYTTQIIFAAPLGGVAGTAFNQQANALLIGDVSAIGATPANAWSFAGIGGSNVLDLSSFFNVYIEGTAPSAFRALPGDADNGTWVTTNGFVQFSANLSGIAGVDNGRLQGLGFCTDAGCASFTAPEPSTIVLLATGFIALATALRRRKAA